MPTDAQIIRSFRKAVQEYLRNPTDEAPTVNSLRERVEKEFDLDEGFFRSGEWKSRSKDVIQDEYDQGANDIESDSEVKLSKNGAKRSSTSPSTSPSTTRPRKKAKVTKSEDEQEDESALSSISSSESDQDDDFDVSNDSKPRQKPKKSTKEKVPQKKKAQKNSSDNDQEAGTAKAKVEKASAAIEEGDDSSSELSSVIDEPPPPPRSKKGALSKKNGTSKSSKPSTTKPQSKSVPDLSPDAEEIKRLQGWLVKCGIRKVWGKELKPYETPKAKIAHLKSMLADAGMTGRYSNEKAAQIKEARELAADIEAVQEGNERWGKTSDSEDGDGEDRRRSDGKGAEPSTGTGRRLVRGARNYDFLSSDGEETD